MNFKKLAVPLIVFLVLFPILFSAFQGKRMARAKIESGQYVANFLGMTIMIPDGWYPLSENEILAGARRGAAAAGASDRKIEDGNTMILLDCREKSLADESGYSARFNCTVMRVNEGYKGSHFQDQFEKTKKLFSGSPQKVVWSKQLEPAWISGKEFYTFEGTTTGYHHENPSTPVILKVSFLCCLQNGYLVTFGYSYTDDSDFPQLERVVESIRFND